VGRGGGIAALARHGREHFRASGKKGFLATCARWFAGGEAEMTTRLRKRAGEKPIILDPANGGRRKMGNDKEVGAAVRPDPGNRPGRVPVAIARGGLVPAGSPCPRFRNQVAPPASFAASASIMSGSPIFAIS
jgi:hypothetical protein